MPHARPLPRAALALAALTVAGAAQATLITFDEFPYVHDPLQGWSSHPLEGVYDHLGVNLGGAYLQGAGSDSTFPNSQHVLGGSYFALSFTGPSLPTYVSLVLSSIYPGTQATATATGPGSFSQMADTGGFRNDPDLGDFVTTPYTDRQWVTFHSPQGIAQISFDTYAASRIEAKFDNLYFGDVPMVPEPATLALWAAGLGVIGVARRQRGAACGLSPTERRLPQ